MDFVHLTPEQKRSFEEDGFLVVRNALDAGAVDRLLDTGDRLAGSFLDKPKVLDRPEYNHVDLRPGLLRDKAMLALVNHSTTVPLIAQLLSPNIHLHSTSLTYKRPENPDAPPFRRGWHRDMRVAKDVGHELLPRVGIKVCYCLTDFDEPNAGMTLFCRGTHLRSKPLEISKGQVDPRNEEVVDAIARRPRPGQECVEFRAREFVSGTLGGAVTLDAGPRPVPTLLLVGPEGGWAEEERALATAQGIEQAGLGKLVLRAETAPLAALSAIRHGWGWER